MKKIILILFLLASIKSFSQVAIDNSGKIISSVTGGAVTNSNAIDLVADTSIFKKGFAKINSKIYYYDTYWRIANNLDSATIVNNINSRVRNADTAAMMALYRAAIQTNLSNINAEVIAARAAEALLQVGINNNANSISVETTTRLANESNIFTNIYNGSQALSREIATRTSDTYISRTTETSLQTGINNNTANITNNTANIATNTSGIANNTANIATNTSNILINTNSIFDITSAIGVINRNILNNTNNIANETSQRIAANLLKVDKFTTADNLFTYSSSSDATLTMASNKYFLVINPNSTINNLTVYLPNIPSQFQTVTIFFGGSFIGTIVNNINVSTSNQTDIIVQNSIPSSIYYADLLKYQYINGIWYRLN